MDNAFLTNPRRGRTRVIAGSAVLAVVLGAVLAVRLAGSHAAPAPSAGPSGGPVAASDVGEDPETVTEPLPAASASGSAAPTVLVPGERVVSGVRVGYPHTLVGAVSATVEYAVQICSTLDPQRAADVGLVVADSSYGDIAAHFYNGPVNSRRYLGLPESGPVPGASLVLGPMAYQVRNPQPDETTVLLLVYLTVTTRAAGVEVRTGVYPFRLVWSAGDWKLGKRAADAPDYAELRFRPGTPEARTAGWLDFVR